ncbi:MAG: hypothetical protein GY718_10125 [Lentisphaerae bacterium]|nr:hypothetical protein [Lentisphaerota bacterium]
MKKPTKKLGRPKLPPKDKREIMNNFRVPKWILDNVSERYAKPSRFIEWCILEGMRNRTPDKWRRVWERSQS